MAYDKYKDLTKRLQSDEVLRDKPFEIASNSKYDGIKQDWFQWFTSFLIKRLLKVVV